MNTNNTSNQNYEPIDNVETEPDNNQEAAVNDDSNAEQTPTNKGFRIGCMTFCLIVTVIFLWVWQHQSQFNDNYRDALFFMRNGEPEKAIDSYHKAIKNKSRTIVFKNSPSAYNNLGQAYMQTGQFTQAIDTFKKVIKMDPDIPEGFVNFGTVYLRMNEPMNAREICIHALQRFPDNPLLHYNLAIAYALTEEHIKSVASLQRAIDLDPSLKEFAAQEGALMPIVPELNE